MRDFTRELKNDHRVIQQVVAGMSAVAELLNSGKQVDPSVLADLVQFLRVFADHCHHEKEEQHLFPLLATKANVSTRRELESLEREHRLAKQLVGQLAKVAAVYVDNPAAVRYRVIDLLQQLAELYPAHIWKEDFLLFPLAQQTLSTTEQGVTTCNCRRHSSIWSRESTAERTSALMARQMVLLSWSRVRSHDTQD